MEAPEIDRGLRHESYQFSNEIRRFENDLSGATAVWGLEFITNSESPDWLKRSSETTGLLWSMGS